ncbi:hypothetical protein FGB62_229g05 [Gracilaria domingensis]|nr:hypothetical protein FGB62_229g05 [Gracilaria domingensis]
MSGYDSIPATHIRTSTDENTELVSGEPRPARARKSLRLQVAFVTVATTCVFAILFIHGRPNSSFVNRLADFASTPRSIFQGLLNHLAFFSSNSKVTIFDEELQSGGVLSTSTSVQSWLPPAVEDWMSEVPDSKSVAHLSIPGTHDSGARYGGVACEAQVWSITDQLRAGIRFFDIRCRRAGTVFAIHHGPCFQEIFFGDVLVAVRDFLASHDNEFVIMNVQENHTPMDGSDSFTSIWATYMSKFGYLFVDARTSIPTVGEVRGKILALRPTWLSDKGIAWTDSLVDAQNTFKVYLLPFDKPVGSDTASMAEKLDLIGAQLNRATTSSKLILNFLSGAQGMTPIDVAGYSNEYTYNHIGTGEGTLRTGVVIMDFPGERLVYRIIKTNFEAQGYCDSFTFRTESDKTWAEFRLPQAVVGTSIYIRGGAYARYVFPKCHRATWTDLNFVCGSHHHWIVSGHWDADAWCHSSNTDQAYLVVGKK